MKKQIKIVFAVLAAATVLLFYSFKINDAGFLSEVRAEAGLVSGVPNSDGTVTAFKGIPFAAPPVGDLRWKAPQPAIHWEGVKKCDAFGPSPMQQKPVPFMVYTSEFLIPERPISEDCLYLNIWTNAKTKADKKPVFVWIYGGGFSWR
jgi:para-nitrobenzyl esterase